MTGSLRIEKAVKVYSNCLFLRHLCTYCRASQKSRIMSDEECQNFEL